MGRDKLVPPLAGGETNSAGLRRARRRPVTQQRGRDQNRIAIYVVRTGGRNVLGPFSRGRWFLTVNVGRGVLGVQSLFQRGPLSRGGRAGGRAGGEECDAEEGNA